MKNRPTLFYAFLLLFISSAVIAQFNGNKNRIESSNNRLISVRNTPGHADALPATASVETTKVTDITSNSATCGYILKGEGTVLKTHGICLNGKASGPTIRNTIYHADKSPGPGFNVQLTGLYPNVKYYIRSFITTSAGVTIYGNEISFTTLPASK